MKKNKIIGAGLALAGLCGWTGMASAHLEYYDLNKGYQIKDRSDRTPGDSSTALPTLDTAHDEKVEGGGTWQITEATADTPRTVSVTVDGVKRFSWIAGTNPSLGDSHAVQFFNFHLDQPAYVNITWTQGSDGLDPAFTLYRGLLVYYGHDDAESDPLNPLDAAFAPIQNDKDTGTVADVQGIVSPFRDTVSPQSASNNFQFYQGQFNALDGWSQGRTDGDWWSAVQYLTHRNDNHGGFETLSNQFLPAGDYTIAAGGAACNDNATNNACRTPSLSATLTFSASATPIAVNTPPAFVGGTTALTVLSGTTVDLAANLHVSDTDSGQTLTWTPVTAPAHGSLGFSNATAQSGKTDITPYCSPLITVASIDPLDSLSNTDKCSLTYTADSGYQGTDTFTLQVSDGTASAARSFTITAGDPLVAPGVATQQNATVGQRLMLDLPISTSGKKPTLKAKGLPPGATLGPVHKKDGQWVATLKWKPKAKQTGRSYTASFTAKTKIDGKPTQSQPLSLTFAVQAAGASQSLAITAAQWNAAKEQYTVSGTGPTGQAITLGFPDGTRLTGIPITVDGGTWQYTGSVEASNVPCALLAQANGESTTLALAGAPANCAAKGPTCPDGTAWAAETSSMAAMCM